MRPHRRAALIVVLRRAGLQLLLSGAVGALVHRPAPNAPWESVIGNHVELVGGGLRWPSCDADGRAAARALVAAHCEPATQRAFSARFSERHLRSCEMPPAVQRSDSLCRTTLSLSRPLTVVQFVRALSPPG